MLDPVGQTSDCTVGEYLLACVMGDPWRRLTGTLLPFSDYHHDGIYTSGMYKDRHDDNEAFKIESKGVQSSCDKSHNFGVFLIYITISQNALLYYTSKNGFPKNFFAQITLKSLWQLLLMR